MTDTPREENATQDQQGIVSRHDRETIARALANAAGQGRLDTEELENRLARTHQARNYDELEQLLADLPGSQQPEERTVAEHTVPETLHITAALRKARRHGRWKVPRRIIASAGRGEVELDFSEAEFTNDKLTVDARPNLSDVELIVPEGHAVTTEEATPGTEPVHDRTTAPAQPDTPHIHIVARAGMGSIIVRHPRHRRKLFGRF